MAAVAHAAGVPVHLDGARLFNAAVALKRPARDFARPVDSVTFCVSKGLGAPVGSLICGSRDFIDAGPARAQDDRRRHAAGGYHRRRRASSRWTRMVDRLAEDHVNARALAEAVTKLPGLSVDLASVQTNIVVFRVDRGDRRARRRPRAGHGLRWPAR